MEMIKIGGHCPFCGNYVEIEVPEVGYYMWNNGVLIQDAFPTLNPSQREMVKTHMCLECQDKIFGGGDEAPDDEDGEEWVAVEDLVGDLFNVGGDGDLWEEELCDDYDDCDCEEGFDPYEGCFTYDC